MGDSQKHNIRELPYGKNIWKESETHQPDSLSDYCCKCQQYTKCRLRPSHQLLATSARMYRKPGFGFELRSGFDNGKGHRKSSRLWYVLSLAVASFSWCHTCFNRGFGRNAKSCKTWMTNQRAACAGVRQKYRGGILVIAILICCDRVLRRAHVESRGAGAGVPGVVAARHWPVATDSSTMVVYFQHRLAPHERTVLQVKESTSSSNTESSPMTQNLVKYVQGDQRSPFMN